MFDVDEILSIKTPDNSELVGLSSMGRFTAMNHDSKIRYGYFPHNNTWSEASVFGNLTEFDSIHDFKFIYDVFSLKDYTLESLTYVINNLRENFARMHNKKYGES